MTPILLNAGEALKTQARLRPNVVGARDLERSLTYSEWLARSLRLASGLHNLGLTKGDRVAVLAHNRVEWAEIYVAAALIGVVAVPINFRLTASEAAFIIQDAGASAILVEDSLADVIEDACDNHDLPDAHLIQIGGTTHTGFHCYETLIETAVSETRADIISPDDHWCLMYTSGTTGNPKGAIRSHRGMAMLALMTDIEFRLHRGDNMLLVMPMCHANSLNFFAACLYCGATITIFSRANFDPELCLQTLGQGVTFSSLVPTHYSMMLDVPRHGTVGSIEKLLVSSATAFPESKRQIIEMFPNSGLYELYGSTEAGWVTVLHPDEQFDHLGTVGREVVGSQAIRMLDDDGQEVPDGEPGELFSCSPYQFDGYRNLPEKTAEALRGNYLSVGDVALRDEQGFIRLIDRKKNLIVSGGENIYPTEVEQVLIKHPDVRDVAVIGRPDPKWSELVVACIVPKPGADANPAQIMEWSRDRLAGFKRPREIVVLAPDEMPRNATGKILHRKLRDMLETRAR